MANFSRPKWEPQDYALEEEKVLEKESQTTWKIKPLSDADYASATDMIDSGKRISALMFAARRGIVGWENLKSNGEDFLFRGMIYPGDADRVRRCTKDEIEAIPREWRMEIGLKVIEISSLGETEKN